MVMRIECANCVKMKSQWIQRHLAEARADPEVESDDSFSDLEDFIVDDDDDDSDDAWRKELAVLRCWQPSAVWNAHAASPPRSNAGGGNDDDDGDDDDGATGNDDDLNDNGNDSDDESNSNRYNHERDLAANGDDDGLAVDVDDDDDDDDGLVVVDKEDDQDVIVDSESDDVGNEPNDNDGGTRGKSNDHCGSGCGDGDENDNRRSIPTLYADDHDFKNNFTLIKTKSTPQSVGKDLGVDLLLLHLDPDSGKNRVVRTHSKWTPEQVLLLEQKLATRSPAMSEASLFRRLAQDESSVFFGRSARALKERHKKARKEAFV